jgi:hypothetical protein
MYIPRNWEFGQAFSKLRNFGVGLNPQTPPWVRQWPAPCPGCFTPGKDPVPIVQEVGWAPELVWTCAKNLSPTGILSLNHLAHSQALYWLSYPANKFKNVITIITTFRRNLLPLVHLHTPPPTPYIQTCFTQHCTLKNIFVSQGSYNREQKYDWWYKKSQYKEYSGWGPQQKHSCEMPYVTLKEVPLIVCTPLEIKLMTCM